MPGAALVWAGEAAGHRHLAQGGGRLCWTGAMTEHSLVPPDFAVPNPPDHPLFRFEPLGPEHNEADLEAWPSSIGHIHSTPGFRPDGWPKRPYTLAENLADLERHWDHHRRGIDFAWTVLDPEKAEVVIGCVYLVPVRAEGDHADDRSDNDRAVARSWVRADCAALDPVLRDHLRPWFATAWPLSVSYAP